MRIQLICCYNIKLFLSYLYYCYGYCQIHARFWIKALPYIYQISCWYICGHSTGHKCSLEIFEKDAFPWAISFKTTKKVCRTVHHIHIYNEVLIFIARVNISRKNKNMKGCISHIILSFGCTKIVIFLIIRYKTQMYIWFPN